MFKIINYSLQMSSKRKNRQKVLCQKCNDILNYDQQEIHKKTKHGGQPVKFQIYTGDAKQRKMSDVFSAPSTPLSVPEVPISQGASTGDTRPAHLLQSNPGIHSASLDSSEAEQRETVSLSQDQQQQKVITFKHYCVLCFNRFFSY